MNALRKYLFLALYGLLISMPFFAAYPAAAQIEPSQNCASTDPSCNICIKESDKFTAANNVNVGAYMIGQIFSMINKIIQNIESSFYNGLVGNSAFQNIIGVAFVLYLVMYGIMITFGLASHRSGEVAQRLIKLAIVYAVTSPGGWAFFSVWVQTPVIGGINQLITDVANAAGSGTSSGCVSQLQFSGGAITGSGDSSLQNVVQLNAAPLSMIFGPMTCLFGSRFIAAIEALITTGFYGWILALIVIWGAVEFIMMLFGAIATYIKSIVGLTFMFGIAPIFFTFYLFEKTRSLTEGWLGMVVSFAIQPVMLFTFLSFYSAIIGTALGNIFVDNAGNTNDVCYVPWYTMPGLFSVYWWRFANSSGVAGGTYMGGSGGSASLGIPPPPIQVLSALYFIVLCNLGKNFTQYITTLAQLLAGGKGGGVITGDQVGSWFKNNIGGGSGGGGSPAAKAAPTRAAPASKLRPQSGGKI